MAKSNRKVDFRVGRSVMESRYTTGGVPRDLLAAQGITLTYKVVQELGYSRSSPSNWQTGKRMPYAAYLAIVDTLGRDEHGNVRAPLAAYVRDGRSALLTNEVEKYASMDTLDGVPGVAAVSAGAADETPAAILPVIKRKYKRKAGALAKVSSVPAMNAAEMRETIQARARHHVNNGNGNGNGHLPPSESFGISMDVPRGFAGARIEFRITPRTDTPALR